MSVNMLDLAKGALGGSVLDSLGGLLGEDTVKTQSAVDSALPAILGGIMQSAATPQGANEFSRIADEADTGLLSNLSGLISGNSGMLLTLGAPLLLKLFGAKQDGLIATIARLAGVGGGSAGMLLKVLAPIVMSMLGQKKKELSLDTGQFQSFLMDQKSHVVSAMPADVSSALGFGDFLNVPSDATETVQPAVGAATDAMPTVEANDGGFLKKLLPAAIIAALGYFGYTQFSGVDAPQMPEIAGLPSSVQETATTLQETIGGVTGALSGITDVDGAQAAVEQITAATETVDGLALDSLPGPAKTAIGGLMGGLLDTINSALETAYQIPGVEAVVKPAIEPLLEKLNGL